MPVPLKDTIPNNNAIWALALAWGVFRFAIKWGFIGSLVLGLIRAVTTGTEAEAWLLLIPFTQSSFLNWVANKWFYLAITCLFWQLMVVGRRLELMETRASAQVAFMGAMMNYVGVSEVRYADDLKRKGRSFDDLITDEIVKAFFRVFAGRWAVQFVNDELLSETRFYRGENQITLKEDVAAVLRDTEQEPAEC